MHYYKFNIGDYHSHTQHLTPLEDIAYRRMMDYCYLHESHLPKSVEQIAKKIRMREHCECIAYVLQEFFQEDEYGYFQPRIVEEVGEYKDKADKAKAAAEARWAKKPIKPNADALQTESERNAKHKTLNTKQETLTIDKDFVLTAKYLCEEFGCDEQVAKDWMKVRKSKKCANTKTAWSIIHNEFNKAKLTVPQGVRLCAERNWAGVNSDWSFMEDKQKTGFDDGGIGRMNGKAGQNKNDTSCKPSESTRDLRDF